jgi:hypothetical protein
VRPDGPSPSRPGSLVTSTTTAVAPPPAPASETVKGRAWVVEALAVVVLLVAAAALRVRPLAPHSLWIDDAWVSLLSKVHTVKDVRRISVASPGFVAFLKVWFKVVRFSELRAQFPAYVFGILGPPAVYLTARAWRLGRPAAFLAGGLVLASPVHIRYSSRVKAFTLEAFSAAVLLVIADRLLAQPHRRTRWYAFAGAAAIATMLSAPLVIIAVPGFLAGFVAARRSAERGIPRAGVEATVAYGLFGIAWYALVIRNAIDNNLVAYWRDYYISHRSVGDLFSTTVRDFTRLARAFAPVPAALTLLALAACALWMSRRRVDRAVLLFGPLVLAAALAALERNPLGGGRTDIYLYADIAIALACGADALLSHIPAPTAAGATAAAVVCLAILTLPVPAYPKEDLREMLAIVDTNAQPEDVILLYPKARFAAALYSDWPFHLRGPVPGASVTTPFDVVIDRPRTFVPLDTVPVRFAGSIAAAKATGGRIWYVGSHGDEREWRRGEEALRRAGYRERLRRGFPPHYWVEVWRAARVKGSG